MKVLVTGGASGIGRATVDRLARTGASIAVIDRDLAGAESAAAEARSAGVEATAIQADVASRESVASAVDRAVDALGGLDACVTAAGILNSVPFTEIDDAEWTRITGVVLTGTFLVCQAVIPALRAAGGGSIVTVTSVAAVKGSHGAAHYAAAKGGVLGLTRSLSHQLAPFGIRVNAVCPGPTRTPIFGAPDEVRRKESELATTLPLGRFAEPTEIANVIAFVAGPGGSFMTGSHVVVDGGYTLA